MHRILLLLTALLGSTLPTVAADDVAAAQSVIRAQEEAFRRDDAAAAYSYAAPGIHEMFQQADIFMFMVQHSYAPVYRHRSFEFGAAQAAGDQIAQRVHIVDDNGEGLAALGRDLVEDEGELLHRRDDDLLSLLDELAQVA